MSKTPIMKYKLVIVVRKDLSLSPGKTAVQVAHASVSCALSSKKSKKKWFSEWYKEGQRKVVLYVDGVEQLYDLEGGASADGVPTSLVVDAGLTEIPPGTITCLGIGPAPSNIIDKFTSKLPLL